MLRRYDYRISPKWTSKSWPIRAMSHVRPRAIMQIGSIDSPTTVQTRRRVMYVDPSITVLAEVGFAINTVALIVILILLLRSHAVQDDSDSDEHFLR